jgi:hypothetical protein
MKKHSASELLFCVIDHPEIGPCVTLTPKVYFGTEKRISDWELQLDAAASKAMEALDVFREAPSIFALPLVTYLCDVKDRLLAAGFVEDPAFDKMVIDDAGDGVVFVKNL